MNGISAVAVGGQDPTGKFAFQSVDASGRTVLGAGQNMVGYTNPGTALSAANGGFYIADTGHLTLTVAGNIRAVLNNPAASGKTLSILRFSGEATVQAWASVLINPTAGVPTATVPITNALIGGPASVATLFVDTNTTTALSGGTATGLVLATPANTRFSVDLPPLIVPPGNSVGINVPFTGAADASVGVFWTEA